MQPHRPSSPGSSRGGRPTQTLQRRSPSQSPGRRTGSKKDIPVEQLLEKLHSLERYKIEEEKWRKKDEMQRKKELAAAKKRISREIAQTKGALRKRNMEAQKLKQNLSKYERQVADSTSRKNATTQRIEEKIHSWEDKHNHTEVELTDKIGQVGEANGLLAYLEYAQAMLEQGVMMSHDSKAAQMMVDEGRRHALAHDSVGDSHDMSGMSQEGLARELAELRMQYEECEEHRQLLLKQLDSQRRPPTESEELMLLREENKALLHENEELQKRLAAYGDVNAQASLSATGSHALLATSGSRDLGASWGHRVRLAPPGSGVQRSVTPVRKSNGLGGNTNLASVGSLGYTATTATYTSATGGSNGVTPVGSGVQPLPRAAVASGASINDGHFVQTPGGYWVQQDMAHLAGGSSLSTPIAAAAPLFRPTPSNAVGSSVRSHSATPYFSSSVVSQQSPAISMNSVLYPTNVAPLQVSGGIQAVAAGPRASRPRQPPSQPLPGGVLYGSPAVSAGAKSVSASGTPTPAHERSAVPATTVSSVGDGTFFYQEPIAAGSAVISVGGEPKHQTFAQRDAPMPSLLTTQSRSAAEASSAAQGDDHQRHHFKDAVAKVTATALREFRQNHTD
eukprot:TRINITY_DN9968_c0_g1_i2.p1 TRINITY_DN9968_c0_g1~~TRINITY_DN9968_c0_g1_i2.p1  ORF type:complete len:621 (-),score=135.42 TRINITY_DN9968_c0_g1_i2:110-1972(-)